MPLPLQGLQRGGVEIMGSLPDEAGTASRDLDKRAERSLTDTAAAAFVALRSQCKLLARRPTRRRFASAARVNAGCWSGKLIDHLTSR